MRDDIIAHIEGVEKIDTTLCISHCLFQSVKL